MPKKFDAFNTLIQEGYDQVEKIQSLWSGYGAIYRLKNKTGEAVIVKHICPPKVQQHPKNWNTDTSHQRKLKSYQVEYAWYSGYQEKCTNSCRIPKLLNAYSIEQEQLIVMEDLAQAGFPTIKTVLPIDAIKVVLKWLANFHARFIQFTPSNLWEVGSYWHLATRPDELDIMQNGPLKQYASSIDKHLNECEFKTIIHGDAKLANFCFSKDLKQVAAVDFQYIGGGCGMKDVAYFLGSCLTDIELEKYESELLAYYFSTLKNTLPSQVAANSLIAEWTNLYPFAWADFERFLLGWAPGHQKLTSYSQKMTTKALNTLNNLYSKNS